MIPPATPQRPAGPQDEPVFKEPWQAHAFALVVELHRRDLFSWHEWTDALAARIAIASDGTDPHDAYYVHWLEALEDLVTAKAAGSAAELLSTRSAWARAAERTPHGEPIELQDRDFELPPTLP